MGGIQEATLRTLFHVDTGKIAKLLLNLTVKFFQGLPPGTPVYLQELFNVVTSSKGESGKRRFRMVYGSDYSPETLDNLEAPPRFGGPVLDPVLITQPQQVQAYVLQDYDEEWLKDALELQFPEESQVKVEHVTNRVFLLRAYLQRRSGRRGGGGKGSIKKIDLVL